MDIKISINDKVNIPETNIFHGNYALERMINKVIEKYYGKKTLDKINKILNEKITEDKVNEFLNKRID